MTTQIAGMVVRRLAKPAMARVAPRRSDRFIPDGRAPAVRVLYRRIAESPDRRLVGSATWRKVNPTNHGASSGDQASPPYVDMATQDPRRRREVGSGQRRVRLCYWKQWKRPRPRRRHLIALGIPPSEVGKASRCRRGYWSMSGSGIVQRALSKAWLWGQGVPNMRQQWIDLHYGGRNRKFDPASVNLTGTA